MQTTSSYQNKTKQVYNKYFSRERARLISSGETQGSQHSSALKNPNSPSHFRPDIKHLSEKQMLLVPNSGDLSTKNHPSEVRKNKPPLIPSLKPKMTQVFSYHGNEERVVYQSILPTDIQHLSDYKFYENSRAKRRMTAQEPYLFLPVSKLNKIEQQNHCFSVYSSPVELELNQVSSSKSFHKWKEDLDMNFKKRVIAVVNAKNNEQKNNSNIIIESPINSSAELEL